jgi:hypothetical protein
LAAEKRGKERIEMFGLLHKMVERIVTWREKHLTEQQFVLILAFFTVLMTYFGVNYFLGGMHSYA